MSRVGPSTLHCSMISTGMFLIALLRWLVGYLDLFVCFGLVSLALRFLNILIFLFAAMAKGSSPCLRSTCLNLAVLFTTKIKVIIIET